MARVRRVRQRNRHGGKKSFFYFRFFYFRFFYFRTGNYNDDVFCLLLQGYANAILASLKYLNEQVNSEILAETEQAPLLEVSLELVVPDVQWSPEIGESGDPERPGVRDLINGWVRAFQNTGTLVRRLDIGEGNYMKELEEDFYILDGVSELQAVILANEAECVAFKESYDCLLYTSPSPRDLSTSRMPSSA